MAYYIYSLAIAEAVVLHEQASVKDILASDKTFTNDMFKQLLVRPDIPHMFLSDVNKLIGGIKNDFPDIVKVDEIGYSWE